jgi:hypothetical protein
MKALVMALGCLVGSVVGTACGADPEGAAARVVQRINAFRAEQGLERQRVSEALTRAAREFASFMAETSKYGHAADGRGPAERARSHGYDDCLVLENIAYTYDSRGFETAALADALAEGWKRSPGHRKNLLDAEAPETGVALAQGRDGGWYGVQMFGRPRSAAITFRVENRTAQVIEYRASEQTFSLAPRAARSHTMCRETQIAIAPFPGKRFSKRVLPGTTYIVSGGDVIETRVAGR